ncbi:hypothetical protein EXN66_Car015055 [Channa argus]|uniref:Uncharacterized protein n=1 Tax=Channa argus TaxID=215402 RepID=A0A6G1QAR8_CHAAH|nr:hypothetical protein EXN66_Car015055 [Channa argus]
MVLPNVDLVHSAGAGPPPAPNALTLTFQDLAASFNLTVICSRFSPPLFNSL